MFTHRHADGGFYRKLAEVEGKSEDPGVGWVPGVLYQAADGKKYWTSQVRWEDRFEELPPPSRHDFAVVEARTDEDELIAAFYFTVEQVDDVRMMFISAANVAGNRRDHAMEMVLRAQADMISKGLHIRDVEFPDLMGDVNAFHVKFDHGLDNYGVPKMLPPDLFAFRHKFHMEETTEYADEQPKLEQAMARRDHREVVNSLELQLDALADAVWVLLGTADVQFGKTVFYEAWRRVVKANMAKVRADQAGDDATKTGRDKKFDIVKPAGWTPPDHRDLVQDYLRPDPVTESVPTVQEA